MIMNWVNVNVTLTKKSIACEGFLLPDVGCCLKSPSMMKEKVEESKVIIKSS